MRLSFTCMACFQELGQPDNTFYKADVLDGNIAKFVCKKDHNSVNILQSHKFEILAELAITAILDGYFREAISSFTSSLERYYEFYMKTILTSRAHEVPLVNDLWNRVKSQSERQFGAYNFMYLIEEDELPSNLSNSKIQLRNKVIHQGLIPTYQETINYGQAVIDVINSSLEKLASSKQQIMDKTLQDNMLSAHKALAENEHGATYSMATLVQCSRHPSPNQQTVLDWLEHTKSMRKATGFNQT